MDSNGRTDKRVERQRRAVDLRLEARYDVGRRVDRQRVGYDKRIMIDLAGPGDVAAGSLCDIQCGIRQARSVSRISSWSC